MPKRQKGADAKVAEGATEGVDGVADGVADGIAKVVAEGVAVGADAKAAGCSKGCRCQGSSGCIRDSRQQRELLAEVQMRRQQTV